MTRPPLLSSTPENSRPTTNGGGGVPGYPPLVVMMSAKFNPPAWTRTRVWPDFAVGSATSCTESASGPVSLVSTRAFTEEKSSREEPRTVVGLRSWVADHGLRIPGLSRYVLAQHLSPRP